MFGLRRKYWSKWSRLGGNFGPNGPKYLSYFKLSLNNCSFIYYPIEIFLNV
jgi:hypothetical protein